MEIKGLKRELGLFDVILFNIAAILGLRWIPIAAATGYGSLSIWLLAMLLFFLPQGFIVAELSTRHPDEGGIYVWTKMAFGDLHGFICGWCYWGNNLTYFPSLLISAAGISALVGGAGSKHLADNHAYVGSVALLILWVALILNMIGMRRGKWIQNIGGITTWVPGLLLILLGLAYLATNPLANHLSGGQLIPDFSDKDTIILWSSLCFALAGLELPSTMGGEIKDPIRTIPRALLISGFAIFFIYVVATAAILWVIPQNDVGVITGMVEATTKVCDKFGLLFLGGAIALSIVVGHLGGVGAWLTGAARVPFVAGLDKHLPDAFGKLHPKWGTPYVALLTQGIIATVLLLASFAGESVKGAYLTLLDMTIIVFFIPYVYMFAAILVLGKAPITSEIIPVPGKTIGRILISLLGLGSTLVAIVLALIPPKDAANVASFELKVGGGAFLFVFVGLLIYWLELKRQKSAR